MQHVTTRSSPSDTPYARLAAGLIGVGLYVVGGGLLLSHLAGRGAGPIDQPTRDVSAEHVSAQVPTGRAVDRRATSVVPVSVSVIGGATYVCLFPADHMSADAVIVTVDNFVAMAPALDCG